MSLKISYFLKNTFGQMYTLEGAATAIMMIFLIAFIVQASPLTPLTSSTSHQQVEAQIETSGNDLLIVLDKVPEDNVYSPLKEALIEWTGAEFHGQTDVYPDSVANLYNVFNNVMLIDGTAYNLEIGYLNEDMEWDDKKMLWNGEPSDNAVLVTKKVVIHDGDNIIVSSIPDLSDNSSFYNILDVRLTLWRM